MRRSRVDHSHKLDGHFVIGAPKHDGERIGKSDLRGAVCNLFDSVGRTRRSHDLDLEILTRVIAFFDSHKIVGVPTVKAVIGNERDLVESGRRCRAGKQGSKCERPERAREFVRTQVIIDLLLIEIGCAHRSRPAGDRAAYRSVLI